MTSLWGIDVFQSRITDVWWYQTVVEAGENLAVESSIPHLYLFFLWIKSITSKQNPAAEIPPRIKKYKQDCEKKGLAHFDVMDNLSFSLSFLPPWNVVYFLPATHIINLHNQTLGAIQTYNILNPTSVIFSQSHLTMQRTEENTEASSLFINTVLHSMRSL